MRAVVFDEFGGPEVLRVAEAPVPDPGPGQVRVAVRAAGVNPADWKIRRGLLVFSAPQFPMRAGMELAGTVDALGPGVHEFAVGDEVFGKASAAYADYAVTGVDALAHKPPALAWVDAAALPVAVETAYRVLDLLEVKPGETVLVNGASGAVGSLATQILLSEGATVIGTASPANQDLIAALGAIPTTYGEGLVERVVELAPRGVDAIFDAAGHGMLPAAIELRGGTDRIVTIADPDAETLGITFSGGGSGRAPELWREVAERMVTGEFRLPAPAREFPLTAAAEAQRASENGSGPGKLVLTL